MMKWFYSFAAFAALSAPLIGFAQAKESYHWVQYVAAGLEARAITDAAECPAATIDGSPAKMVLRSEPSEDYPIRVCVVSLPLSAAKQRRLAVCLWPCPLPNQNAFC